MKRSLVIFGNGVGLALDEEYFKLASGLSYVWNDTRSLSDHHKKLILSAVRDASEDQSPQSENQLDLLQVALIATDFLSSLRGDGISWLSHEAESVAPSFRKYIHEVALHFHKSSLCLPEDFVKHLSDYINKTKSHVVTLNYDNLLYDSFIRSGVLDGYNGSLIDGFWRHGFCDSHLDRYDVRRHGWYMHVHGSPLFIDNNKVTGVDRHVREGSEKCHIVLSHGKYKPLIISSSEILSSYWRRLGRAIAEVDKVILFGYSGLDDHLNSELSLFNKDSGLLIVEWSGSGSLSERNEFWKQRLRYPNYKIVHLDNILNFNNWG